MCKKYELLHIQVIVGDNEFENLVPTPSQLKAAQSSKAIWMILGWKSFTEEMSWALKNVQIVK